MAFWNRKPKPQARDEPPEKYRMEEARKSADYFLSASEAISAAASRIANTMATAPLHLYKNEVIAWGDPLDRLISFAPGPGMTGFSFVRDMELNRCTHGRAFAWIVRAADRVTPLEMMMLDPARVTVLRAVETGDIWHEVCLPDMRRAFIPDADMFCLSFLSQGRAARPIDILRGTMQYDQHVKEFSLSQLDGVNDTILLTAPTELGRERKARIVNDTMEVYKASGKAALLLDAGMTATRISGSPVDPKVLDVERVTKTRVSTVYGIPPHMMGASENMRGSSEEEMMEYLELAIMPPMAQWEAEAHKKLLSYAKLCKGCTFHFDRSQLAQANTDAKTKLYHSAIRDGYMKPNEVRRKEYMPPDKNGGQLMCSRDMLPMRVNVETPELLLTGARGKTNEE